MVTLKPMTEDEYQIFIEKSFRKFLREQGMEKTNKSQLDQQLREKRQQMLPNGLQTPNHFFFSIIDDETQTKVGDLWFAVEEKEGEKYIFIYDIHIDKAFRRKGFGSQAFRAMEDKAKAMGIHKTTLHVFGHNTPAREMYKKLGYIETHVMMEKTIH